MAGKYRTTPRPDVDDKSIGRKKSSRLRWNRSAICARCLDFGLVRMYIVKSYCGGDDDDDDWRMALLCRGSRGRGHGREDGCLLLLLLMMMMICRQHSTNRKTVDTKE